MYRYLLSNTYLACKKPARSSISRTQTNCSNSRKKPVKQVEISSSSSSTELLNNSQGSVITLMDFHFRDPNLIPTKTYISHLWRLKGHRADTAPMLTEVRHYSWELTNLQMEHCMMLRRRLFNNSYQTMIKIQIKIKRSNYSRSSS